MPEHCLIGTYFSELIDLGNSLRDNRQALGENILPGEPGQKAHGHQTQEVGGCGDALNERHCLSPEWRGCTRESRDDERFQLSLPTKGVSVLRHQTIT